MFMFLKFNPHYQFYISLGLSLLVIIAFILFKKVANKFLLKLASKIDNHSTSLIEEFNTSLKRPLEYWWLATGLYIGLNISPFVSIPKIIKPALILGEEIQLSLDLIPSSFVTKLYTSIIVILIAWALCNLVSFYEKFLDSIGSKINFFDNPLLIRFSGKIIKLIVIVLGGLIATQTLFSSLGTLLTGVGFAGAAFTFIAKDTLTDILSGIILMIDKPFTIGDWIQLDTLEGIVEDVSFRSTRIRTFTQGLVVIPNSTLSDNNITNWSAMTKRRVSFDLGLTYSTSKENLEVTIQEIEHLLQNHPMIEKDTSLVYFNTFGDFSLNITIIYYSLAIDLKGYSKLKEDINLKIIDIVNDHHLNIAFPTQSILLDKQ